MFLGQTRKVLSNSSPNRNVSPSRRPWKTRFIRHTPCLNERVAAGTLVYDAAVPRATCVLPVVRLGIFYPTVACLGIMTIPDHDGQHLTPCLLKSGRSTFSSMPALYLAGTRHVAVFPHAEYSVMPLCLFCTEHITPFPHAEYQV